MRVSERKKRIIRIIIFGLALGVAVNVTQHILQYKNEEEYELSCVISDYELQDSESIDIVCVGTSEVWDMYIPTVGYNEAGITGYNFGTSRKSAVTAYYQVKYVLKKNRPKAIICDFSSLYSDSSPAENEELYRKIVQTMPDRFIRYELINAICSVDPEQDKMTWFFPIIKYHSGWNELTPENFGIYENPYRRWTRGGDCRTIWYDSSRFELKDDDIAPELWNAEITSEEFSALSVKYYNMLIDECHSVGVDVIALIPPKLSRASQIASRRNMLYEYFDENGVIILDYNTYEQVNRLGLSLAEDYYDPAHVNILGGEKCSRALAKDLQQLIGLEDRRNIDDIDSTWDEDYESFCEERYSFCER